jgi:hypothetical protein
LTQSAGIKGAVMQISSTLSLARQWAITHRDTIYVVFPHTSNSYLLNKSQMNKAVRSYAVYSKRDRTFVRDWSYLPPGLLFIPVSNSAENIYFKRALQTNAVSLPGITNGQFWTCIIFRPDGTLPQALGTTVELYLQEGFVVADTNAGTFSAPVTNAQGTVWGIEMSVATGQIKIEEL